MAQLKIPKIHIDVWLDAEDLNVLGSFGKSNGLKNYSQVIREVILEWRRFKTIAMQMQKQQELKRMEVLKDAQIEKK